MSETDENSHSPLAAATAARLFPLPNLVMFPHVVQPLHIFEPRYCTMLEDALAGDKLIAMVLLEPGWEGNYDGRPRIAPVACLGKVMAHERLPTGRHNILLRGLRRAAIRREVSPELPFRQAEVDLLDDFYPASAKEKRARLKRRLVDLVRQLLTGSGSMHSELDELLTSDMKLGMMTDVLAFTLGFPAVVKQRLLAEWNVDRRAELLADKLAALTNRLSAPPEDGNESGLPQFRLN